MTKEELRNEYEKQTGKSHGNVLFSTTDYSIWLEKKVEQYANEKTKKYKSISNQLNQTLTWKDDFEKLGRQHELIKQLLTV